MFLKKLEILHKDGSKRKTAGRWNLHLLCCQVPLGRQQNAQIFCSSVGEAPADAKVPTRPQLQWWYFWREKTEATWWPTGVREAGHPSWPGLPTERERAVSENPPWLNIQVTFISFQVTTFRLGLTYKYLSLKCYIQTRPFLWHQRLLFYNVKQSLGSSQPRNIWDDTIPSST